MTTYYVRKTGNDGNTGLNPTTQAWLTVDNAANNVAAGDTVYIGAGVYRELVTMDTSGTDGNVISFLGDFTGQYTGDAGLVVITPFNEEASWGTTSPRSYALEFGQKEFILWSDVMFIGGAGADNYCVHTTGAGHVAYEQVTFRRCIFYGVADVIAVDLIVNNGATPATTGFTFDSCTFLGTLSVTGANNVTAHYNLKAVLSDCMFYGFMDTSAPASAALKVVRGSTANAFSFGGITMKSCQVLSTSYGLVFDTYNKNATNPCNIYNSYTLGCYSIPVYVGTGCVAGAWNFDGLWYGIGATATLIGPPTYTDFRPGGPFVPGFMLDHLWRYHVGWSPYRPAEMVDIGLEATGLNQANPTNLPSADIAGNSFAHALQGGLHYTYFDASDAAVTDPNNAWSNDANICVYSPTSYASTLTQGSDANNYIMAEGVAVGGQSSAVDQVRVRVWGYGQVAAQDIQVRVYTNGLGETLGTLTYTLPNGAGAVAWSSWLTLSAPAAGWDWATVAALEFRCWKNVAGASACYVGMIQVEVRSGANGTLGPMQSANRSHLESTTPYTGTYARHFDGAGERDMWVPVDAESTTVTCWVRYDSNYKGANLPQMVITNTPGFVADVTATMTAAANTWEQLSCTFTPTASGYARVRIRSRDTGRGLTIFDDAVKA